MIAQTSVRDYTAPATRNSWHTLLCIVSLDELQWRLRLQFLGSAGPWKKASLQDGRKKTVT
jgi:hypothetical protein